MERPHIRNQVVIQDAGAATWCIQSKCPRHAGCYVVLNHCISCRATYVDSKVALDREAVDRDTLTVCQVEGRRTGGHAGFWATYARPAGAHVWSEQRERHADCYALVVRPVADPDCVA